MRWRLAVWAGAMLFVLGVAWGALADAPSRRVALVIANADYAHSVSLKNPIADGELIKEALAKAGFEIVDAPANLSVQGFRNALRGFQAKADGSQVALVYYAGHGIEAKGRNWLIPTDATLEQDRDLDYEAIDLDLVLNAIEGAQMRVVVLDACRDNPFGRSWHGASRAVSHGLAPVDLDDVLVIYSAAPGQTASDGTGTNSPFAEALAHRLPQAGVPIQMLGGLVRDDVLAATGGRQRPFISASVTGTPFFLAPAATSVAAAPPPPSPAQPASPAFDPRAVELAFWNAVAASNDAAQYRAYLDRYPSGQFAALASLKSGGDAPAQTTSQVRVADARALVAARPMAPATTAAPAAAVSATTGDAGGPAVLETWLKAAQAGDARAQNTVGVMYRTGRRTTPDYAKALGWFRKAADQGYVPARTNLGLCYLRGQGVAQDFAQAMAWFRKAADGGGPEAMSDIGMMYDRGDGVAQDFATALSWFRKAAALGNADGQANLGAMYLNGRGVAEDDVEAARWFRLAADQGLAWAQQSLAFRYARGQGVPRDLDAARLWMKKAADQGEPRAQTWLANHS